MFWFTGTPDRVYTDRSSPPLQAGHADPRPASIGTAAGLTIARLVVGPRPPDREKDRPLATAGSAWE
jgi:hypothetical protein